MRTTSHTRGQTGKAALRGGRSCGLTLACLWMFGCGGNGSTPPPPGADADARPGSGAAYPVPVYVQQVPVYPPPAQMTPSWGGVPNTAMQPVQPYAQAQGQYPAQQQYAPPVPVQQSGGYNPWAIQAQRQHHANGWATSQPWGGAVHQQPAPSTYQYRPLEGDARQTPPVAAPYDQPFGSSQRPLPAAPGYGAYAGGYAGAGAWPGHGGPWGGAWPGGQYGGYPGYGAGWPGGGWGGMPYGGGFPGMWPGMW